MMELHSKGKTINDIEEVLQKIPLHPRVIPAIKAAHDSGYVTMHLLYRNMLMFFLFIWFVD